jgi:hypothetical protein
MADEWVPTEEDIIVIAENNEEAYSVLQSGWLEEVSTEQGAIAQKRMREAKREWLTDIVINWLLDEGKIS